MESFEYQTHVKDFDQLHHQHHQLLQHHYHEYLHLVPVQHVVIRVSPGSLVYNLKSPR